MGALLCAPCPKPFRDGPRGGVPAATNTIRRTTQFSRKDRNPTLGVSFMRSHSAPVPPPRAQALKSQLLVLRAPRGVSTHCTRAPSPMGQPVTVPWAEERGGRSSFSMFCGWVGRWRKALNATDLRGAGKDLKVIATIFVKML